jgi:hypothetical protein
VKIRFKRAMDMMFAETRNWSFMCCRKSIGACDGCDSQTLAYATSSRGNSRKITNTNIRFCPRAWKKRDVSLGWTVLHELMHITSSAGDKGYSKMKCINLAKRDPQTARRNAAAYTYYAREAGMTRTNYLKSTGPAVSLDGRKDSNSDCMYYIKSVGKGCCGTAGFYGSGWDHSKKFGKSLKDICSLTCPWVDGSKKCGGTRPEDPARLADQATVYAAAKAAKKRRISNDIRRCKEDGGTNCDKKFADAAAKKEAAALKTK